MTIVAVCCHTLADSQPVYDNRQQLSSFVCVVSLIFITVHALLPVLEYETQSQLHCILWTIICTLGMALPRHVLSTGAALIENNEASAKLTTANGGTFT